MTETKHKQIAELIELLLDGSADESSGERIVDLLRDDPDAQLWYVEYCQMHAMLAWEHGAIPAVGVDDVPLGHLSDSERVAFQRQTQRWRWLAICASILLAVSVGLLAFAAGTGCMVSLGHYSTIRINNMKKYCVWLFHFT